MESRAATSQKQAQSQVQPKRFPGHTDSVQSCEFCANDTKFLTSSYDQTVVLWDRVTGTRQHVYEGHSMYVTEARANGDASRFVSTGWDKKVNFWDTETGQILWTKIHGGAGTCCAFSHNGKYVVSASDQDYTICIWDAETGEMVHHIKDLHTNTVSSIMFSYGDDRIITTSMDMTTKFWDLKTQQNTITLKGHVNIISGASISTDNKRVATVSWDKSIQIWDVSTGEYRSKGPEVIPKAHEGSISSCCFSDNGRLLVTGGYDRSVALWDLEDMVPKLRLQGHLDWVEDVCFSKDMKCLLSCSKDKTVRLWHIEEGDKIPQVREGGKTIGLKVHKCTDCGKPFSTAQVGMDNIHLCVFCRLQSTDRNIPEIEA